MGSRFLEIKLKSPDEKVRIALAHVNKPSDCAAFDLMYHRNCLRIQERKIYQTSTGCDSFSTSSQCIADVDILNAVKCSLSKRSIITMNDICKEYIHLLKENCVHPVGNSTTYKKHLKRIISENIDDVKFVNHTMQRKVSKH